MGVLILVIGSPNEYYCFTCQNTQVGITIVVAVKMYFSAVLRIDAMRINKT